MSQVGKELPNSSKIPSLQEKEQGQREPKRRWGSRLIKGAGKSDSYKKAEGLFSPGAKSPKGPKSRRKEALCERDGKLGWLRGITVLTQWGGTIEGTRRWGWFCLWGS